MVKVGVMSKRIISFSLWGSNPKYVIGAIRNAELAELVYPGWICRFYVDFQTIPSTEVQFLSAKTNVQILSMPGDMDGWKGMFARFLEVSDFENEVTIVRDCDSRLSQREADAVNEWLESPRLIHVMRDHPHHTAPILGGMWGAKQHAIPNMKELIAQWNKEDRWQTDQEFLRDVIWPQHYHKAMAHDDWNRFSGAVDSRFFPTPRDDNDFVGAIIGANEERLHPEHHEMV